MASQHLSLVKTVLQPGALLTLGPAPRAIWLEQGEVVANGEILASRIGWFANDAVTFQASAKGEAVVLRFEVTSEPVNADELALMVEAVEFDPNDSVLRLDTVTFPPGAIAYRHTHAGPGIRYLFEGRLEIATDHGLEEMTVGTPWFEPSNSPVKATAQNEGTTAFVRAMIVPKAFEGVSTFKLCDAADAEKPRRQVTHRFFDAPLV